MEEKYIIYYQDSKDYLAIKDERFLCINNISSRYCPKKVCKLQSSYICVMNKKSTKNNEAYKRTKIGINF